MKIAVGNSRMDKKWKNRDISWENLCQRVSSTIRTTETVEEYRKLKKGAQDNIKDVGGFVGGQLREGRRKNGMVLCRSMLTLDMDYGEPGIWDEIDLLYDFRCCVYSTHKHTPEHPRLRMIIPLARDITEEEYPAVARMVAKEIGIDLFDDTTYEACRLMYWPSTSANGEFFYKTKDGPLLDPDAYLAKYADWHDASTWPVSSRQSEAVRRSITQQADPLEKPGIVGAFCRAYTIEEAIETFLSDVYEPSSMNGRYDYIPADSAAGVVVYDGKFAYSHHATDPVCGKLLNAFDLVRLHKFRELDENVGLDTPPGKLPSFKAMSDLALGDDKVKTVFAEERIAQASAEFSDEDWQNGLELDKSGHVKNTLHNLTIILENDPNLKGVVFNQLLDGMEIKGEVPWKHPSKFWRDADDAQLISYVDAHYGTFSARNYDIAVTKVADDRAYHPIREFIESLPEWDKVPRVDTLLVDYLGASDTAYVRAVTRKTLCAAISRVLRPGCKFDSMLVLNGPQGVGKGTQAALLAEHFNIPTISTGDIFRYNIKNKTELGLEAMSYTDKGELVPDSLTNKIVKDRLAKEDCKNGWILDGYPRNAAQVIALDEMLADLDTPLDHVVALEAARDVLLERMKKRAAEQGRADDTPEAIAKRLETYEKETAPLLDIYEARGLLVVVNGVGDIDEISGRIISHLE